MLRKRRVAGFGSVVVLALTAAVSCGGSTSSGDGDGARGGSSGEDGGAGVSGSGGTGATAGALGAGGTGATAGAGGAGGQGGLPARCTLPSETGNCDAYFPMYFHDPLTGVCEPFVYGGCGGNENRFETREACQAACRGGAPDMDACTKSSECAVATTTCCGTCRKGTANDVVGINFRNWDRYYGLTNCGVACGPCPEVPELETTDQYFVSTCESGACTIVDIRETPVTECATDADCVLRDGAACCQGCDGTGLVSVRPQAFFDLLCREFDQGCPPCEPIIPSIFVPRCANGRCGVAHLTR